MPTIKTVEVDSPRHTNLSVRVTPEQKAAIIAGVERESLRTGYRLSFSEWAIQALLAAVREPKP